MALVVLLSRREYVDIINALEDEKEIIVGVIKACINIVLHACAYVASTLHGYGMPAYSPFRKHEYLKKLTENYLHTFSLKPT